MLIMQTGWPIATRAAVKHEVDKKAPFPPVGPGHCQQLHPFIFMWWKQNLTQRFSTHPYQRDAGTVWASTSVGRPAATSNNTGRLDTRHNKHWPGRSNTKRRCRVCSVGGVKRTVIFRCVKCDVALCVDQKCFEDYHTKTSL